MDDPEDNASRKNDVLDDLKQIEKSGTYVDAVTKKGLEDSDGKKEKTRIATMADVSEKLWSNEIIWEIVTSYLNISDLKSFSYTNKYFLQRVRSISRFSSLSGQVVMDRIEIHVFKLTRAFVEVNKLRSNSLRTQAEETFKDTEYLELRCLYQLSDANLNSRLIQMVSNCPKLKSLVFTPLNGLEKNLDVFFKNVNVRKVLSNLNELHLEVEKNCTADEPLPEYRELVPPPGQKGYPDSQYLCKNFPELPIKLTSFSYTEPDWSYRSWFSPSMVLSSSQNTLVKLELKMPPKPSILADLVTLKFPKLEKLHLNIKSRRFEKTREIVSPEEFTTIVLPFLKTHISTLTEFKLWYDIDVILDITPFQELLKSATKMKVLDIILQDASLVRTYSDWDFLKTIATLHSFEMKLPCGERINVGEVSVCDSFIDYLNVLPSTIRSIIFGGVRVSGVGRLPIINQITSSMMRFRNVTVLKWHLGLDDQILGFICKHFTQLLDLEAYFNFVSDHGICGISEDGYSSERSLSNLKGLNKLVMKASFPYTYHHNQLNQFLITWDGLISAIHFLGLVELRVEESLSSSYSETELNNPERQMFQDRNFLRLVSSHRNPSLEKVYFKYYVPGSHILEELKTVNPRIKV